MNTRPFQIAVVSEDRCTLRRLARFLGAFGFQVMTVAEPRQIRAMHQFGTPDFMIIDGREDVLQACQPLLSNATSHAVYTLQLASEIDPGSVAQALKMGVNDFLAKPIVFGELLARLRAGARFLEYERRMRRQSAICSVTSLLNESAFRERLGHELGNAPDGALRCILVEIDSFKPFRRMHGAADARALLRTVAEQLKSEAATARYLASCGDGRFAALLVEPSDTRALAWAETIRDAVAAVRCPGVDGSDLFTASIGVAGDTRDAETANQRMDRAEHALRLAIASGGNCVVRCGQFDEETRNWENLARAGRLFENTTARDIMLPCPRAVAQDMDARTASQLFPQTGLHDLPVIDHQEAVVGLLRGSAVAGDMPRRSGWRASVADLMVNDAPIVDEDSSFNSLMDYFMDESKPCDVVIVARRSHPIGLVYRSGLAALSQPLNRGSFAPATECDGSTSSLVVPDLGGLTG